MPSPCPFCGVNLLPVMAANGRDVATWSHPRKVPFSTDDCYYAGHCIGSALVVKWNRRVPLHMEIVNGHPRFNVVGTGSPVTEKMVNDTVAYYRSQT